MIEKSTRLIILVCLYNNAKDTKFGVKIILNMYTTF